MLYLFYNTDVRIIKVLKLVLSRDNMILSGKNLDDIAQFNPDKVFCFQNNEVIDKCLLLNRKCVHLTTKNLRDQKKNLIQFYLKLFDLNEVRHKTNYSFSMLDESVQEIIRISNFKETGNFKLFNKGYVHAQNILDFFKTSRKLHSTGFSEIRIDR